MREKNYLYFYILSFFLLITLIIIYKRSKKINKIILYIIISMLSLQFFIVYDTHSFIENNTTRADGITDMNTSVISEVEKTASLDPKQNSKPILDIVNKNTTSTYKDFKELPSQPTYLNTFSENQIKGIMKDTPPKFSDTLKDIARLTTPK